MHVRLRRLRKGSIVGELYKITFKTRGKSYIGITIHNSAKRIKQHAAPSCTTLVGRAYNKYGRADTKIEILATSDDFNELCRLEREAICKYNTLSPNGYNRTVGGEGVLGHKHSKETRTKLSAATAATMKSIEARARISAGLKRHYQNPEARARQSRAAKVQVHTAESKAKVSAAMKGRPVSEATRKKIRATHSARIPRIEKTCVKCNVQFHVKPSRDWQKYCSKVCADAGLVKAVSKVCAQCGISITVKKSNVKERNYCSLSCSSKGNNLLRYSKIEKPPAIKKPKRTAAEIQASREREMEKNRIRERNRYKEKRDELIAYQKAYRAKNIELVRKKDRERSRLRRVSK